MVFGEAIAAGLIAIGPDHGGPVEILSYGDAGLIADPFSPQSVADALHRFVALSPTDRAELRERAFALAKPRMETAALPGRLEAWLRPR